ncbi:hypothetical protein ACVWYN_000381 [Pedobacter sp. UYP24]
MKMLSYVPLELLFWVVAIALLALAQPIATTHENHFTLCPLAAMGFDWCPGCGIGRAITQIFHGNLNASLKLHWFGIPGLLILVYRILELIRIEIKNLKRLKLI